jgi:hypothetical protein
MKQVFSSRYFVIIASFVTLIIVGCSSAPPKKSKKSLPVDFVKKTIYVLGKDSLDLQLVLTIPKTENKKYSIELHNSSRSAQQQWTDSSWSGKTLDTCLLPCLGFIYQQPHQKAQNATYKHANNYWRLIEEKAGSEIDTQALYLAVKRSLRSSDTIIDLTKEDLYVKPRFSKDDEALKKAKRALNMALNSSVEFTFGSSRFSLTKAKFATWLSLDDDLKLKVDHIAAQNFIQDIARVIEKPLSEILALHETEFQTDTLMNQTYPRMPIFQEVDFIISALPKGKAVQRPIVFVPQGLPKGLKEGLKDFVEVSILDQKLWLFKDGQLVLETSVVTGNEKYNRATPKGRYHILHKTTDRVLRGPGYASFVKYWMPFYQGYGLHDATWRRRFGANIYQNAGSHGCVNIPPKMAPVVYNNVFVGMDVIVR